MERYGLLGKTLKHSFSKIIHESLGTYEYDLIELTEEELDVFMTKKEFKGVNVTIPYKRAVIPYLDYIDEAAKAMGAVNTIVNRDGKLYGYNTDFLGFTDTITDMGLDISGEKVLVIGNGGASKAVICALEKLGASEILIVKYKVEEGTITYEEAARNHSDAKFIVNTSPVGMYPNVSATPIDLAPYNNLLAAVDIIYNPLETVFLKEAREKGSLTANGLKMLVNQALYAYEFFTDTKLEGFDDISVKIIDDLSKDKQQ